MAEIDTIVKIDIVSEDAPLTRASFGTPLVLAGSVSWSDAYRVYQSASEVAADFTDANEPVRKLTNALFGQDVSPSQVVVWKTSTKFTYGASFQVVLPAVGQKVELTVFDGTSEFAFSHTVVGGDTAASIAALIDAFSFGNVTAIATGDTVDFLHATPGNYFYAYAQLNGVLRDTTTSPTGGLGPQLDAALIYAGIPDWYWILSEGRSDVQASEMSAWTAANGKIAVAPAMDDRIKFSAAVSPWLGLKTSGTRLAAVYHHDSREWIAGALVGDLATREPGSYTAAMKQLNGISPSTLSTTQKNNIQSYNINHYMAVRNRQVLRNGTMSNGEFIDIIHGVDALEARIQEDVFTLLADSAKVPFTDAGFVLIENAILGASRKFEGDANQPRLLTVDSSDVVMPKAADISAADKAARRLTGVLYTAKLEGAVHYVEIQGTVSN